MNTFEFRVFIIGDELVGKKSIVNRFKKLNSTQTEEDTYFYNGDPKDEYGLGTKKTKEALEKLEIYQQLNVVDKNIIRKEIERKNLMKFKKIFIVDSTKLEFNFFPIKPPEEKMISNANDNKDEEDEVKFGSTYLTFKKTIEEITKLLSKEPKYQNSSLANIFLFVYELRNYNTFKKLECIYNKLDNYFKSANYLKALIGNKQDIKIKFNKSHRDYLDNFINSNNFKAYDISTYNYFSFEKFFEQLFIDLISPLNDELQKITFLNRFHLVLHIRATISRAPRKTHYIKDVPFLSENENPDVYAYPENKNDFRRTFSNMKKGRYSYKIFINKQGPTFPIMDKFGKERKLGKPKTAFIREKKSGIENWAFINRQKELKEAFKTYRPGYSLGIREGFNGFKQLRKIKYQQREEQLKSAFQCRSFTTKKKIDEKKEIDYFMNKTEFLKDYKNKIQDNENRHIKERIKNKQLQEELFRLKIERIHQKQEKYDKKYARRKEELLNPKSATLRKVKSLKKAKSDLANHTLYDIRTKYDPNKGWTMGMKYTYDPNKYRDDPDFPNIKTVFDKIVEYPKYAEIKYTAPRFKETKIVKPREDVKTYIDDTEGKKKIMKIKESGERANILRAFFEDRKYKKEKVIENKQILKDERNEDIEELKYKLLKPKDPNKEGYFSDITDINYRLVEYNAPIYSIKGRHKAGGIFQNLENEVISDDEEENKIGSNGKPIQDEEYKKSLPVPQFEAIKPTMPMYSFTKAKRFSDKPLYQISPNSIPVVPFENGKFGPDDVKTFSIAQGFMGKANKNMQLKSNGIPGPGQYKIKGFAEKIADEGRKIFEMRERKKKERELKEMEMEIKNAQIDKGKDTENHMMVINNNNEEVNNSNNNTDNKNNVKK